MGNAQGVGPETVRGELVAACGGVAEVFKEFHGIFRASLPEVPVNHQLGFPFDGDEAVGVPLVLSMAETLASLFLAADETPKLIAFDVLDFDPGYGVVEEPLAVLPHGGDQIAQSVPVNSGEAFCRPDRHSFQKQLESHHSLTHVETHIPEGFGLRADEGLGASLAAVSLMSVAVFPVFLRDVLAVVADHDSLFPVGRIVVESGSLGRDSAIRSFMVGLEGIGVSSRLFSHPLLYVHKYDLQDLGVEFFQICTYGIGMTEKRPSPGRPPLGTKPQDARLYLRTIQDEKSLFEKAAKSAGLSLSDWIKDRLTQAARRELKRNE